jgi:hypothetical protein
MHFLKAVLIALCVVVLSGCEDEKPPNPQDVWGNYKGHYGTTEDDIQIHQDGSFDQTLNWKDKVFNYSGKWSVQGLGIAFSPIYVPAEFSLRGEPRLTSNCSAVWVNYQDFRRLAFDIDSGYVLDRSDSPVH